MKRKIYTRPVCVMISQEMYQQLSEITMEQEISVSDYIRLAVNKQLLLTTQNTIEKENSI